MTDPRTIPNTLEVAVDGLDVATAHTLARRAVLQARRISPKSSGLGARHLSAYWGEGYFGLSWSDPYMWYQEMGIRAFTMRSLAGKVIPMWVHDPTGTEAAKIPAKDRARRTRTDASGKRQVLIFRKAATIGARKRVPTSTPGIMRTTHASYPGAPGRISHRTTRGTPPVSTGRIAAVVGGLPHSGVRWRFPGLIGRGFLHHAVHHVAVNAGLGSPLITPLHRRL